MFKRSEGPDEAINAVFRGVVDWGVERCDLAGYTGDVDDGFGSRRFGDVVSTGGEEAGEGKLGGADWVGEIDVEAGVAGGGRVIF